MEDGRDAWLYRVALNTALQERRSRETCRAARLDEMDRALVVLHLEEQSYREVAAVLGDVLIQRARVSRSGLLCP